MGFSFLFICMFKPFAKVESCLSMYCSKSKNFAVVRADKNGAKTRLDMCEKDTKKQSGVL